MQLRSGYTPQETSSATVQSYWKRVSALVPNTLSVALVGAQELLESELRSSHRCAQFAGSTHPLQQRIRPKRTSPALQRRSNVLLPLLLLGARKPPVQPASMLAPPSLLCSRRRVIQHQRRRWPRAPAQKAPAKAKGAMSNEKRANALLHSNMRVSLHSY